MGYGDNGEDDDTAGEDYEDYEELEAKRQRVRREENLQSIMVPLGDMFNHRDPPNVIVQDSPTFKEIQFLLDDDGDSIDNDTTNND